MIAQAEDRALADTLGLTTLESDFFLGPATVSSTTRSFPVKMLVLKIKRRKSLSANTRSCSPTSYRHIRHGSFRRQCSSQSQIVSVGYSQADASATIEIKDGVKIEGGGSINITSDGSATASMSTETAREEQGLLPGTNAVQFAASVAVSKANLISRTTVAETAVIHGGRTVNIRALGEIESEAEAESGLFANGTAALALGLQFSNADILAKIEGKVTADMNTNGGEVVKFEFDPTTTDPTQPGFIDYDNDRILVYDAGNEATNFVVVTEDTVDYSPRRGDSIGGLDAGQSYYVIALEDDPDTTDVDESHYIQLAKSEAQAIDGVAINLTPGATVNRQTFDASNIDGDKITLPGLGNKFELGQAVRYYEPGHFKSDVVVEKTKQRSAGP